MKLLTILALGLIGYDGLLHLATLLHPRTGIGDWTDTTDLPWLLYPKFPSWESYDMVWAAIHLAAFAILTVAIVKRRA